MKRLFVAFTLLLTSSLLVKAQSDIAGTKLSVEQTLVNMFQALSDRDTVKLKTYCTADILILENGVAWNMDTLVLKVEQTRAKTFKRINTLDFIDFHTENNTAWTTYNNQAEITVEGKTVATIKWLETAILVKEGGQWKLKVLHSTLVKRS